jgi:FkbM family methyltransferase
MSSRYRRNMITLRLKRLLSHKRPFKFLLGRMLSKTGLCRFILIRTHGYLLRFHPTTLSEEIWYDVSTRYPDIQFLRTYLRPGDTYIDVGANIGNTVIPASQAVAEAGRVLAFEPHPRIARYLQQNLAANCTSNVIVENVALGAERGEVSFTDLVDDDRNQVDIHGHGTTVPLKRLDDFTETLPTIALLKIDVEGYEKHVIEGGRQTLERCQCVYFEASEHQYANFGYKTADLLRFFSESGFTLFRMQDNAQLTHISPSYTPTEKHENLIATRDKGKLCERLSPTFSVT